MKKKKHDEDKKMERNERRIKTKRKKIKQGTHTEEKNIEYEGERVT